MAGVPSVFKAMVESLLPTLTGGAPLVSESLRVERAEGDIAGPLGTLAEKYPALSLGSYPFIMKSGVYGSNIVIRGAAPEEVRAALDELRALFRP
jgi:molybdopterin-biosynthesis enzyme MoeA-like protein